MKEVSTFHSCRPRMFIEVMERDYCSPPYSYLATMHNSVTSTDLLLLEKDDWGVKQHRLE